MHLNQISEIHGFTQVVLTLVNLFHYFLTPPKKNRQLISPSTWLPRLFLYDKAT